MNIDDIALYVVLLIAALYFAFRDRFVYRSPRMFRHGGLYLKLWGKQYRVFSTEDPRLKSRDGDDE
jgi:hypothetical protein